MGITGVQGVRKAKSLVKALDNLITEKRGTIKKGQIKKTKFIKTLKNNSLYHNDGTAIDLKIQFF